MDNFDLTATFINASRFLAESHKFSTFSSDFPGRQPAALASLLVTSMSWTFSTTSSTTCQVYHNPAYHSCLKTGNFWFDSPLFEETGCYTVTEFRARYEKEVPGEVHLHNFDLYYFRAFGTCVRYKQEAHEEAKHRPPPPPPKPPVEPVKFHDGNSDPELEEEIEKGKYGQGLEVPTTTASTSSMPLPTNPQELADIINASGSV
jgi:hypothetical protein